MDNPKVISIFRARETLRDQPFQRTAEGSSDPVCADMSEYFKNIVERDKAVSEKMKKFRAEKNVTVKQQYSLTK